MPPRNIIFLAASLLLHACSQNPAVQPQPSAPARPAVPTPGLALPAAKPEPSIAKGDGIAGQPEVQAFIADMVRKHGFDKTHLTALFADVNIHPAVLAAINKPYEAKPWHAYKKLFLTDTRIQGGVSFLQDQAGALATAERKYGVPAAIITAILGVESGYGQKPGNYRVIEALSTLSFAYPKRAAFFRSELEQFLLLSREEGMDPKKPLGSYAGAMGLPQFMPSSYRKLAADGDGDGHRDIWNNPADAIASVARYFAANGWHSGEPVAQAADGHSSNGKLLKFEEENGPSYWLSFHNFDVIMRYNHSPLYAMAAYQLSEKIK